MARFSQLSAVTVLGRCGAAANITTITLLNASKHTHRGAHYVTAKHGSFGFRSKFQMDFTAASTPAGEYLFQNLQETICLAV